MARAVVPLNFNAFLEKAKLKDDGSVGVIGHGYPEDGKMILAISCHFMICM